MMRKYLAMLVVLVMLCVIGMGGATAQATFKDGLYTIGVSSSAKMFKIVNCVLRVENGSMTAVLTMSGSGYGYLYQGTSAEADAAPVENWTPYFEDAQGRHCFAIEIPALDEEIPMAAWSIRYSKWYDRTLQFFSNTMTAYQEIAPVGVYSAEIISDTELNGETAVIRSDGDEMQLEVRGILMPLSSLDVKIATGDGWLKVESQSLKPYSVVAADGVYSIAVETDSALLKFLNCCLTVANGEMSAQLTVADNKFDYIYIGCAADANGDADAWIPAVPDANGNYKFEIPVESLDNGIAVATHSAKKNMWYEREILLDSSTLIGE